MWTNLTACNHRACDYHFTLVFYSINGLSVDTDVRIILFHNPQRCPFCSTRLLVLVAHAAFHSHDYVLGPPPAMFGYAISCHLFVYPLAGLCLPLSEQRMIKHILTVTCCRFQIAREFHMLFESEDILMAWMWSSWDAAANISRSPQIPLPKRFCVTYKYSSTR